MTQDSTLFPPGVNWESDGTSRIPMADGFTCRSNRATSTPRRER